MDEKTAPIPSLKDFREQHRDRSAQSGRTNTMQTRGQQRRSAERQSSQSGANPPKSKGKPTGSRQKPAESRASGKGSAPARQGAKNSRDTDHRQGQSTASRRKPAGSAPHTYARERNAHNEGVAQSKRPTGKNPVRSKYDFDRFDDFDRAGAGEGDVTERTPKRRREPDKKPSSLGKPSADPGRTPPAGKKRTSGKSEPSSAHRDAPRRKGDSVQNRNGKKTSSASGNRKPQKPQKPKKPRKPLSPTARKWRNFFIYVGILLVVLVVGAVLSLTVLFRTENINVSGNALYKNSDIVEKSGLLIGDNIFTSPKKRAEDKLERSFPYIEEADVYSVFPDTINIDIKMATPACVIDGLGGYYIVSDKGKVLEVASTVDELDAPVIEGVKVGGRNAGDFIEYDRPVVGTALMEIFATFKETNAEKITAINVSTENDSVELKYVYDNRIVVYLGLPEHIAYKVQTAQTIISEKLEVEGTLVAGDLDVSMCYDTSKSYFNQYSLLPENVPAPEAGDSTEPTEETVTYEY